MSIGRRPTIFTNESPTRLRPPPQQATNCRAWNPPTIPPRKRDWRQEGLRQTSAPPQGGVGHKSWEIDGCESWGGCESWPTSGTFKLDNILHVTRRLSRTGKHGARSNSGSDRSLISDAVFIDDFLAQGDAKARCVRHVHIAVLDDRVFGRQVEPHRVALVAGEYFDGNAVGG